MVTPIPPGGGGTAPEAAEAQVREFNIDEALNTKGFPEFLAQFPDSEKVVDDAEEMEKRFGAFEKKSEVTKNMRELFRVQIQQETGLRLTDKDLEAVETLIGKEALANPERIGEIAGMIDDYRGNAEDIGKMEAEIQRYGGDAAIAGKLAELKEKKDKFGFAPFASGQGVLQTAVLSLFERAGTLFGRMKGFDSQAIEDYSRVKKEFGLSGKAVEEEFTKIENEIKFIEDAVEAKAAALKEFSRLRVEVMEGFLPVAEVMKAAKTRAQDRLTAMLADVGKDFTLKKADETEDFLAKLQEASASGNTDYLEGVDAAKFTKDLNALIETKVGEQLVEAINKSPIANGSLAALEKALEKFRGEEKIGSREGDEVKAFIIETLANVSGDAKTPAPKKILINRVIAKLNA